MTTYRAILITGTDRWPYLTAETHALNVQVPEGADEMASLDAACRVAGINHFLVQSWTPLSERTTS